MSSPLPKWKRDLPMMFTYLRILCAPVVMVILYLPWVYAGWAAAVVFVLASLTDWIDGHLARLYRVESAAGQLMDPVADKLLVLGALVMLLSMGRVDAMMVFLLVGRDIFIGGVRALAASNQVVIAAKPFGKWKTGFQMVGLPCLLIYDPLFDILPLARLGYVCLWISVALSMVSGLQYTRGYFKGSSLTH